MRVCLECEKEKDNSRLDAIAERWQLIHDESAIFSLVLTSRRLELRKNDEKRLGAICVDFLSDVLTYRRKKGGGRGEAIVRAAGVRGSYLPKVLDATAGLGRDAFILAAIGCQVKMLERNPIVAALLEDGLQRGYRDPDIGDWLQQRLQLCDERSLQSLERGKIKPDVVYLDPMFPSRGGSASIKKEMRVFHTLVGIDSDADTLLLPAMQIATRRVVVKRPYYASYLGNVTPHASSKTKKHRFDLYMPKANPFLS